MPVPFKSPLLYRCQKCAWKSHLITGDVVFAMYECPKCGSADVKLKVSTLLERIFGKYSN